LGWYVVGHGVEELDEEAGRKEIMRGCNKEEVK
jgi:hypothetical protein